MRFLKEKKGIIISFIIGVIIASSITVYAYSYYAKDIGYTKPGTTTQISVESALNDLYSKSNKTAQQVTTLTTQGATYTMQNDGYIIGTSHSTYNEASAYIFLDGDYVFAAPYNDTTVYSVSLYAPKNTVVSTRSDGGTYNLTVYEWK